MAKRRQNISPEDAESKARTSKLVDDMSAAILRKVSMGPSESADVGYGLWDHGEDRNEDQGDDDDDEGPDVYERIVRASLSKWPALACVTIYLSVYDVRRAQGGREEGVWWYDYGVLVDFEPFRVWLSPEPELRSESKEALFVFAERLLAEYGELETRHRFYHGRIQSDFVYEVTWRLPVEHWSDYAPYE